MGERTGPARLCGAVAIVLVAGCSPAPPEETLWELGEKLRSREFVDLTHAFHPGIPHWKGFPDSERKVLFGYEKGQGSLGSGFFAEQYTHVGQWGTHVDPPAHFHKGLRTLDRIEPREMLLPLVVLDISSRVAADPDTVVAVSDLEAWEARHGPIPAEAFVALRSDWSRRWPDPAAMANADAEGVAHYPGWSLGVLRLLLEKKRVTAIGHETTDTDPGVATSKGDYSLESYVLGTDHYQIELMANLDRVPEAGALLLVSFPKPRDGSGFPARLIAILP